VGQSAAHSVLFDEETLQQDLLFVVRMHEMFFLGQPVHWERELQELVLPAFSSALEAVLLPD
jgi:hypothetical protein